jgi:hypothetical protein
MDAMPGQGSAPVCKATAFLAFLGTSTVFDTLAQNQWQQQPYHLWVAVRIAWLDRP